MMKEIKRKINVLLKKATKLNNYEKLLEIIEEENKKYASIKANYYDASGVLEERKKYITQVQEKIKQFEDAARTFKKDENDEKLRMCFDEVKKLNDVLKIEAECVNNQTCVVNKLKEIYMISKTNLDNLKAKKYELKAKNEFTKSVEGLSSIRGISETDITDIERDINSQFEAKNLELSDSKVMASALLNEVTNDNDYNSFIENL